MDGTEKITNISISIKDNGGMTLCITEMRKSATACMYDNCTSEYYEEAYGAKEKNKVIARVTQLLTKGDEE